LERARYLRSLAVRSGQAVPTYRMAVCSVISKSRVRAALSPWRRRTCRARVL
jgi:hypothetical protein